MLVHVVRGCPPKFTSRPYPGRSDAWFLRTIEKPETLRPRLRFNRTLPSITPATVDDLRVLLTLDEHAHQWVPLDYVLSLPDGTALLSESLAHQPAASSPIKPLM